MLAAGDAFPSFDLPADDGSRVSSHRLRGRTFLLYFYPKADTPGCTREACAFRDNWSAAEAVGLQVFGVSFDTPDRNHRFRQRFQLPFPLLSDSDQALAKEVGAKLPLLPVPKRISYLIGTDGRVLKAYPVVRPRGHAAEVLADLARLS